jgi:hypothetical protein
MNRSANNIPFNLLALIMLGLTALACLCASGIFLVPALAGPFAGPPRYDLRLPTGMLTATPLFPPTWTPTFTPIPLDTATPFATNTPGPTDTPFAVYVPITSTKKVTVTPTPRETLPPWKFFGTVTLQASPINPCGSSYIIGTIADLDGKPFTSSIITIHVEGDADIDTGLQLHPGDQYRGKRVEGRSPFGGMGLLNDPSAWSVVINQSGTSAGTWYVWLLQGGVASNKVEVRLGSDCGSSAAVVRFAQKRP